MPDNPDLGEQALSKVVELGLASQLDEVEDINVDIRTDPGKVMQGEVDSVAIDGKGMVMQQDLRMEEIRVKAGHVAINPLKAVFGELELTHPADATAQIVLTETDINRALRSDYLRDKLCGLTIDVDGQTVTADIQRAEMHLPGDGTFVVDAAFLLRESGEVKQISATAKPHLEAQGQRIELEILSAQGRGLTSSLANALLQELTQLLDLRNFDMPGMTLRLHKFEANKEQLILHAQTTLEQLPSA